MNIFKRIWKFFFPDKERKADRAQQLVDGPHLPLSSVRKTETINQKQDGTKELLQSVKKHVKETVSKKERIFRILPNLFSKPGRSVFRRPQARKRKQHILLWDDERFPERWRHKVMHH